MCPGRRAFGSCLVVAPGYVAHSHHNPGAAVPAAPVAGVIAVFGAWGGRQLARCCRVWTCCLGGIATIGVRHAGDTPSRGFYGSKTPVARRGCAVDGRCCAQRAVHLGRMRRKGVFGARWTTLWARFCDAGCVPSGLVGVVGVVGARGGCQLVRALLSCAVAASLCPVPVFGLVVWGELLP